MQTANRSGSQKDAERCELDGVVNWKGNMEGRMLGNM